MFSDPPVGHDPAHHPQPPAFVDRATFGRAPSYPSLVYVEKLGVVALTVVAVFWVLFHLAAGRPGRAAEIATRAK